MRSGSDLFACGRGWTALDDTTALTKSACSGGFLVIYKTQTTKKNCNFFGFKIMFDFSIVF